MTEQKKASKNINKFSCELCDYVCSKKGDYNRHLKTRKHRMRTGEEQTEQEKHIICQPVVKYFECELCNKIYKSRSAHWAHKKKCNGIIDVKESISTNHHVEKENDSDEINELKKSNKMLTEQISNLTTVLTTAIKEKTLGNTTNNTTNNNTTNNQFNLNIFLNEKCKDAMNIQDFVDQIKLQLSDLETQGSKGYVEGISNIFIKNLDEMDEDKRPIHCTDTKRETLYVKNAGNWEKGETSRDEMKKAIDTISKNNVQQFGQWINENPQCKIPHTPKADQLHQISSELAGNTQEKNIDKIIRKIAKGTTIDKN